MAKTKPQLRPKFWGQSGAFSSAGGGRFSDGFLGAFVGSESSGLIGQIGGNRYEAAYFSASNEAARVAVSAIVGGTVSRLTGGSFTEGAVSAAFQRLFNDERERTVFDVFRRTLSEMYPNFQRQDPIEYKAWQKYASGFSAQYVSSDKGLEYYAMVWQGFSGYLSSNAYPILGQMYGDWESHQLLTEYFSMGLADFLDIPSAGELVTASREFYVIQISGPQIVNEVTFESIFNLSYGQLIPQH